MAPAGAHWDGSATPRAVLAAYVDAEAGLTWKLWMDFVWIGPQKDLRNEQFLS